MNKIKINIAIAFAALMMLSGCAVTDFDRGVNFSAYKTFGWGSGDVKVDNPVYESGLIHKNIRTTIEEEFAKRGIVQDRTDPDFIVSYHTYTEKEQRASGRSYYRYPFFYPYGFYPFAYGWGWGWGVPYGYSEPRTYTYTEGTLIIDVSDAKTDELVWRGTVKGKVDDVKNLQKQIAKGVKAIMKKYPITPADSPLVPRMPDAV
jgi:hypothetical protein